MQNQNGALFSKEKIVKLIRLFGNSTADSALDPSCLYFTHPGIEGLIAYRLACGCAIVFGDPICSSSDLKPLVKAFHSYHAQNKTNIIYLIASENFVQWVLQKNICSSALAFGEELLLFPLQQPPRNNLLRKKLRKAAREGISVSEYLSSDPQMEEKLKKMVFTALCARKGPQTHIAQVNLFQDRFGKRWFYAESKGEIIAVAWLNQLEEKQGWMLSQMVLSSKAPGGSSEFLIATILETLEKEKCPYLSLGAVPAKKLSGIHGLSKISCSLIQMFFHAARRLFHLDGKKIFWEKFQPQSQKSYVLFSNKKIKIKDLLGLTKVTNMHF